MTAVKHFLAGPGLEKRVDARLPAVGGHHHVAVRLQRVAQRFDQQRIVVDDQDAQLRDCGTLAAWGWAVAGAERATTGNVKRMVVPRPGSLSISISAPWRWAMP